MELLKRIVTALRTGRHILSPNCREASRLQSEVLDHSLSPAQRLGLRLHLLVCKWCRRYGKQIDFLRQAVHEHPEELTETTPRTLSPEARDRIKRSLSDEAK